MSSSKKRIRQILFVLWVVLLITNIILFAFDQVSTISFILNSLVAILGIIGTRISNSKKS